MKIFSKNIEIIFNLYEICKIYFIGDSTYFELIMWKFWQFSFHKWGFFKALT
jgi:hypothetical protein